MKAVTRTLSGTRILEELLEFASFPEATQAYIRRALDVRSGRPSALLPSAGNDEEAQSLAARIAFYDRLDEVAAAIPGDDLASVTELMRWLVPLTAFDIAHTALGSFAAYRFLYERLLGAAVRPWLLGAFCTAAALPQLDPHHRVQLLRSIDEAGDFTPEWASREPLFHPERITPSAAEREAG